jgi:hypothetical protein
VSGGIPDVCMQFDELFRCEPATLTPSSSPAPCRRGEQPNTQIICQRASIRPYATVCPLQTQVRRAEPHSSDTLYSHMRIGWVRPLRRRAREDSTLGPTQRVPGGAAPCASS